MARETGRTGARRRAQLGIDEKREKEKNKVDSGSRLKEKKIRKRTANRERRVNDIRRPCHLFTENRQHLKKTGSDI